MPAATVQQMFSQQPEHKADVKSVTQLLKQLGLPQLNKATEAWIAGQIQNKNKRQSDPGFIPLSIDELVGALGDKAISGMLGSTNTFVRRFQALRQDPFLKKDVGERGRTSIQQVIAFRSALAAHFDTVPAPGAKAAFLAWRVFKQEQDKLFLPVHRLEAEAIRADLDEKDVIACLVPHPKEQDMYTTKGIQDRLDAAQRMLTSARVIPCSADALGYLKDDGDDDMVSNDGSGFRAPDLDEVQMRAVLTALSSPVSSIFGGAGVGKTKTVGTMIEALALAMADEDEQSDGPPRLSKDMPKSAIVCSAFTHKAVKCLERRVQAMNMTPDLMNFVMTCTIDSLICKVENGGALPKRLFLILDEASMISLKLFSRLHHALSKAAVTYQLCLVGDDGQLRPIDKGEVFRYLLTQMPAEKRTHLKKCYRVENADLFRACEAIRGGAVPPDSEHFRFVDCANDMAVTREVAAHIRQHGAGAQYVAWRNEDVVQISILVQNKLLADGVVSGDAFVQDASVRSGGKSVRVPVKYHVGDRVVFNGNKYKQVTRSSIGKVTGLLRGNGKITGVRVQWDSCPMPVDHRYDTVGANGKSTPEELEEEDNKMNFMLAYCMTVHKSQGSEFPHVVVACYSPRMHASLDDRRWLYTAVSRGSSSVVVIGNKREVSEFVAGPIKPLVDMPFYADE